MSTVKRITDLTKYSNVLPYASELFGVYQPLIGWRSKRLEKRFNKGFQKEKSELLNKLNDQFSDVVDLKFSNKNELIIDIKPGVLKSGAKRGNSSFVLEKITSQLPKFENYKSSIWKRFITEASIDSILAETEKYYTGVYSTRISEFIADKRTAKSEAAAISFLKKQLQFESSIAGAILYLVKEQKTEILEEVFYKSSDRAAQAEALIKMITSDNRTEAFLDIDKIDPTDKDQLAGVSLSPISVVHLFRQYFFELDTFLGTPESHVWLSPGSSATLIEQHTRRTIVEKTVEDSFDIFTKSESQKTIKDEISDAVSSENSQTLNLGASVTASYTKIEATGSFDYESSQNNAREKTHKTMREQTQKLSSEIRKNYKTTFKTVSEITEFSSTEHLLTNTTQELINYELRRKMRQVGVQVQDIGTYLCWQTYVDDPGKDLGLANLMHLAQSPELDSLKHPEEIPRLQTSKETKSVSIPFRATNGGADKDEVYVDGAESDGNNDGFWGTKGDMETIQAEFPLKFISPLANHTLKNVEFDSMGKPVIVSIVEGSLGNEDGYGKFTLYLNTVNFEGSNSIQINLILHWEPNGEANIEIDAKNKANTASFKAEEQTAYEAAYLETVKDRIDAVSNITPRNTRELREEERIVIYRRLIQEMLLNKVSAPDDKTRHVLAELINSIFDVDKMLYFVAPEWWRPRIHRSKQQLYETPGNSSVQRNSRSAISAGAKSFAAEFPVQMANEMFNVDNEPDDPSSIDPKILVSNTVGWGDTFGTERDNYYITEDSAPAKFGSSLGWLLQIDGDNRRNAFLNSPWVKSVMPIRPGKEKAAINWLKAVEGMNGITDEVVYKTNNPEEKDINGNPLDDQKMIDVLMDLASKIDKKHKEGLKKDKYPKASEVSDPALVDDANTVTSTPIDRVYEHGFFPLENSFRANIGENYEVFDQWIEILPTDQTVPVEVKYDPITGRQL